MELTRRNLLAVAALAVAGTALGPPALARRRVTSAGLPMTTLDRTVIRGPEISRGTAPGALSYHALIYAAGEPHMVRKDLLDADAPIDQHLLAFAQISDMQIVDDQSPLRVEFLDRYATFGEGWDTGSAYRPQEMLSTHLTDAMCRAIQQLGRGPVTHLPLAFTIATGDMVDNAQYNETRWYIDLLDGRRVHPDSGSDVKDESVSSWHAPLGVPILGGFLNYYWHPAKNPDDVFEDAHYGISGFPELPDLLRNCRRPFDASGLVMPWYAAYGNHDAMVQGNINIGRFWGDPFKDIAVGSLKPMDLNTDKFNLPRDYDGVGLGELFQLTSGRADSFVTLEVTADPRRRLLGREEFIEEHFTTTGLPVGHGFKQGSTAAYYEIPAQYGDPFQFIALDSAYIDDDWIGFGGEGGIGAHQFRWLEERLKAHSSRWFESDDTYPIDDPRKRFEEKRHDVEDRLIVLYCHHTLETMNATQHDSDTNTYYHSGPRLRELALRFPNVIMLVDGHTHANNIWAHARPETMGVPGGFWEINTAAHIDWPVQSRIIEVAEGGGVLSIFTTMIDADAPLGNDKEAFDSPASLAALGRELAANDPYEVRQGIDRRRGTQPDGRNTQLLLPAPFPIPKRPVLGPSITSTLDRQGTLHVFGTDREDRLFHRVLRKGASTWDDWEELEGGVCSVTAVTANDGKVVLFGVSRIGELFIRRDGDASWGQLDGEVTSVAAAKDSSGYLFLYATTRDGQILTRMQSLPGSLYFWTGWGSMDGALTQITAQPNADGTIQVTGINRAGQLYTRTEVGLFSWTAWTHLDSEPLSALTVVKDYSGRLVIVAASESGQLSIRRQAQQNSPSWSAWTLLSRSMTQVPAGTNSLMSQVSATTKADGKIALFGVNSVGQSFVKTQQDPVVIPPVGSPDDGFFPWASLDQLLRP